MRTRTLVIDGIFARRTHVIYRRRGDGCGYAVSCKTYRHERQINRSQTYVIIAVGPRFIAECDLQARRSHDRLEPDGHLAYGPEVHVWIKKLAMEMDYVELITEFTENYFCFSHHFFYTKTIIYVFLMKIIQLCFILSTFFTPFLPSIFHTCGTSHESHWRFHDNPLIT